LITFWVMIGAGMLTLLAAAITKRNKDLCKGFTISINGAKDNLFVDEKDITKLLMAGTNGKVKGEAMVSFNLMALEELLEDNVWVKDAQLYFDNQDILHVAVIEREPVARIFTVSEKTFYIDSSLHQMPLSDKMSARVPVFTSFPDKKILNGADSMLLNDIKKTALFILQDPFWMAQVEQLDITADQNFEMIPTVGNHIVKLGNGADIEKKFHRLMVFYKDVLSKTGFDKYSIVDVEYAGQVVGTRKGTGKQVVDSAQLRLNVEKLLQESRQMQADTSMIAPPVKAEKPSEPADANTDIPAVEPEPNVTTTNTPVSQAISNPVKQPTNNQPDPKPVEVRRVPRAVMPPRHN
jgi:cell division protein FtsQ